MKLSDTLRSRIESYLDAVEAHAAHLGDTARADLKKQLECHLFDALRKRCGDREPVAADVEAVLAEMDPPESFAPENPGATPLPAVPAPAAAGRGASKAWMAIALAFLAVNTWGVRELVRNRGAARAGPVEVCAFSADETGDAADRQPLAWTFTDDMAMASETGRVLAAAPLSITPHVAGAFQWASPRDLVFTPDATWPPCHAFEAVLEDSFTAPGGRRIETPRSFSFQTAALKLLAVEQADLDSGNRLTARLVFNAPPHPDHLTSYLKLQDKDRNTVHFEVVGRVASSGALIRTSSPVPPGAFVVTALAGLPPARGTRGLEEELAVRLVISDELKLQRLQPQSPAFERPYLQAFFNVPVDAGSAASFISIKPKLTFTATAIESWYGNGLRLTGDFEPGAVYQLTFREGLRPAGTGPALASDVARQVQFPNRPPSLALATDGQYLSPRGKLLVGLAAVNLRRCTVRAEKIYPNNLVRLALRESDLESNYYGSDAVDHSANLNGAATGLVYEAAGPLNREVPVRVDLRDLAGPQPSGAWLLTAEADKVSRQSRLLVVTDLGLAARRTADGVLVWVNSLRDAKAVAGAEIVLYSDRNQELARGTTEADGVVFLRVAPPADGSSPFVVTAVSGADLSFLKLDAATAVAAAGGESIARAYPDGALEANVFTDRGIYRPGETVHTHAIVRDRELNAPAPFPALFLVRRPDGRLFREIPVTLSANGGAEAGFALPDFLPTGRYAIDLVMPGTKSVIGSATVAMEEFVPPQIAASVEGPAGRTGLEPFDATVTARHLFGRPAADLPVSVNVTYQPAPFTPTNWAGWTFGDSRRAFYNRYFNIGRKTLDADGAATFRIEPSADWQPPAALKVVVGATVTETSGRSVSAYTSVVLDPYDVYIGLKTPVDGGALRVGETNLVALAAVKPDGSPAAAAAKLTLTLFRVQWTSALRRQDDGRYAYESREIFNRVTGGEVALKDGRVDYALTVADAGEYLLAAEDPAGGSATSWRFRAAAPNQSWVDWAKDKPERADLSLDRERYEPGQTARLSIRAPFSGTALLTIESDRHHEHRLVTLEKNAAEVSIDVRPDFFPNAHCTLTLIRPAVFESAWTAHRAAGSVPLRVIEPLRKLAVTASAPEVSRPQSKLAVKLQVRDAQGGGRAADVVVAAVDEAICRLTDFSPPDPFEWFHALRRAAAEGYDIYGLLLPILDGRLAASPSHAPGGAGELSALRRRLNPVRVSRFKPVALWASSVRTSDAGGATVEFDVPEFTGELRVMAVAYDRQRLGAAHTAVKIRRPLVVQNGLPRFLAPGDECRVPLTVFNETGADRDVKIAVSCSGPLSAEQSDRTVRLAAGAQTTQAIPLKAAARPGAASVTFVVTAGDERYEETIDLAVRPAAAAETRYVSGALEPGREQPLEAPATWLPGAVAADVAVSPQPDARLGGALDSLLRYPYGCLEQTVSAAFPLLALPDLANRVRAGSMGREEPAAFVRSAVLRVLSMQQGTGCFGMWPNQGDAWTWGTAYAAHFLVEAKRAGHEVPADRLELALGFLKDRLDLPPPPDASDAAWLDNMEERAYACHVLALAGQPDAGWTARLREQSARLRFAARVHLASALMLGGQPREGRAILEQLGVPEGPVTPRRAGGCLGSDTRDTALLLGAWLDLDPKQPAVPELVKRLEGLQVDGTWYTTQDTAMALLALGKYVRLVPADRRPFAGRLTDGAGAAQAFADTKEFRWSADTIDVSKPPRLLNDGPGRAWFCARLEGVPVDGKVTEEDRGLKVRRAWLDLKGQPLASRNPARGDLFVLKITIDTQGRAVDNLAIEELLPAGLEIENPNLATAQMVPWITEKTNWCVHRDIRDDRLILFAGTVYGTASYYVAVRAVTPGRYVYPSIRAHSMYDPGIRSVSGRETIEVTE